ncbi:zinc finger MYM-type protein 1-like protein [Tanacetum coccineum]
MRGRDESVSSLNRGMYLEALHFLRDHNEEIRAVTLENAPKNCILTSPKIQKDIVECFAKEIVNNICLEIGDDVFSLLVDESSDVVKKEQMAVVLRYVDKFGLLKERFLGIIHVKNTSSSTIKAGIDSLFNEHKLSMQQLRGQGYDGSSNMRGEFNGLKALILKENDSAYYVHCFAHQLQLVVVAVAKNHKSVRDFFDVLSTVMNVVCGSCKRKDILQESHKERLEKEIENGEIETGRGKNQEVTLARAGDTRWGSHHRTITSLIRMFPEVLKVLHYVEEEGDTISNRGTATGLIKYFKTLDFVFLLYLLLHILGVTNTLSRHLQKSDQTILEAVSLVKGTKRALQEYRETSFPSLLKNVASFCGKHDIEMVNMAEFYLRGRRDKITNQHHFMVDIFNTIMDMQIQEFGDRFSQGSTDLLDSMAALSPHDSFSEFSVSKLVKLSEMYPRDFTYKERLSLPMELGVYYHIVRNDDDFANLDSIAKLAQKMVDKKKHTSHPLVYRLLKLALVLPVATATVERCFSKMKLIKTNLRNRMGDEYFSGALTCAIEKEELVNVKNEGVRKRFFAMEDRRIH